MICPKCGAQNMDGVTFCGSCGAQIQSYTPNTTVEPQQNVYNQVQQQPPSYGNQTNTGSYVTPPVNPVNHGLIPPKNYMTEAIIVTLVTFLCCCSLISLILGIIAIIKANSVNDAFARGNYVQANSNADAAKKLTLWAAIIAIAFAVITTIVYFVIIGAGISELGGLEEILKNLS